MPSPRASAGSWRNRPAARSFSPRPARRSVPAQNSRHQARVVEARVPAAGFTQLRCNSSDARSRSSPRYRVRRSAAGWGFALVADFRVVAPEARFAANFVKLVIHPGFGITATLPRVVGLQRAALMLYTGRRVKAEEALGWGL